MYINKGLKELIIKLAAVIGRGQRKPHPNIQGH